MFPNIEIRTAGLVCTLFILCAIAIARPAEAAAVTENIKVQISPSLTEIEAMPGETISRTVLVNNLSDTPLPVRLTVENFTAGEANGALEFYTDPRALSADSWLTPEPAALIVSPHSERPVQVRFIIPPGAEPGGRFVALFAQPAAPDLQNSPSVVVRSRVGSLFFLTVKGNLHRALNVESFQISPLVTNSTIEPQLQLHNQGNVHVGASGQIKIRNLLTGTIVSVQDLGTIQSLTTLPGQLRTLRLTAQTGSPIGIYRAELTISPQGLPMITLRKSFVVVPLLQLITAILGLLMIYKARHRWLKAWSAFRT